MQIQKSVGTLARWVWSEIEATFPSAYLLGQLKEPVDDTVTTLPVTIVGPPPAALPLTIYVNQEQLTLHAINEGSYAVDRGQNATQAAAHAAGILVLCDSYQPVARDYSLRNPPAPLHFGTHTLCYCEMTANQMQAAQQDPRLIVLPSLYDTTPIPETIATALAGWGITAGMTQIEMLQKLGETEPQFIPEV